MGKITKLAGQGSELLVIVGALAWLLYAFGIKIVEALPAPGPFIVYVLVGLAGIVLIAKKADLI